MMMLVMMMFITDDDDDDVYYYIRWRLKLEGETENMGVCTINSFPFSEKKKKRQFEMDWIKIMNGRAHKQPSLALLGLALLGLLQCLQAMIVEPEGQ